MRPNCFYDTFFSIEKALDKYNICAKINTLRPYIAKLRRFEELAFTDNPGQNCWDNSIDFLTFAPYSRLPYTQKVNPLPTPYSKLPWSKNQRV